MSKEPRAGREEILECQVMWEPDGKKNTQMDRFRAAVGAAFGLALENYDDLYHWSVESYSDFWATFWKFSGIVFSRMYDEVVDTSKGIADVPEWFRGSRLNYAENLLRHEENDKVALYAAREGREEIVKVTFGELRQQVALFAAAMRKMGVKRGDRVVGYLPNGVHAVEAMLAAASIGAIWSSTSPDFGVNGVLDRFSQIQPRLIFSVEAVMYNGKEFGHLDKLLQVVKGLPDLERVVLIPYLAPREKIDISRIPNRDLCERSRLHTWPCTHTFLSEPASVLGARRVFLGFSDVDELADSGPDVSCVTGVRGQPQCALGPHLPTVAPERSAEETVAVTIDSLAGNAPPHGLLAVSRGDDEEGTRRGAPASLAVLCSAPQDSCLSPDRGTSRQQARAEDRPPHAASARASWRNLGPLAPEGHQAPRRRRLLYSGQRGGLGTYPSRSTRSQSTLGVGTKGEPSAFPDTDPGATKLPYERPRLEPVTESHLPGSNQPKAHTQMRAKGASGTGRRSPSTSALRGGTDIISCFMGQNFSIPVYRGEIQARNLGMAVEAWSEEGKAVWGESGELVCTKPLPCQPTHFWNDENGSKYRKAYFSRFPGVWAHGDYCRINPKTGGIIMLGRSDGTLNPNGVRFGSSEIYNIVEAFEEVVDSLCVPQYSKDGEERVLLFLKMASGHTFGPALASSIRSAIRRGLSARHVPSLILETKGIPYTLNGKKVEVAVKQVIAGRAVEHRGAFLNPETLDLYRDIPELQGF
ncbi:acetoacetyl-CoA synthetase [Suricata suricatta]|uniref:acetoacetyl-CoA synthetase n=1 Tax=Suricata suricatta TaxID=37032 RepID=UPI001155E6E2|nr:acetoacetyl-CoA synthetase [Suricata suricatta]